MRNCRRLLPTGGRVKAPVPLDGIMKNPTLVIDGKAVIKDGKYLV